MVLRESKDGKSDGNLVSASISPIDSTGLSGSSGGVGGRSFSTKKTVSLRVVPLTSPLNFWGVVGGSGGDAESIGPRLFHGGKDKK